MSQHQSGFRSFHSTVAALLEATDNWAFNIDRGYVNAVVFLDLKKAFDTVNHPILLSKLSSYGVKGNAYDLLASYLDKRTQKCAVNGVLSKSCTLTCGIPQGTVLGPLLFLLYINDLPNCLSVSQPRMYADDTQLTYADNDICSIEASLNQDLSNINRWLIANKLTLNMTKTEFMLIGSRKKLSSLAVLPALEINGTQLNRVNFTKSLGVLIDEDTFKCRNNLFIQYLKELFSPKEPKQGIRCQCVCVCRYVKVVQKSESKNMARTSNQSNHVSQEARILLVPRPRRLTDLWLWGQE